MSEYVVPAPEIVMREATEDETPKTARSLARLARAHGWTVVITYARGTWFTGPRSAPRVIDSIAVRMYRQGDGHAIAFWHDARFHSAVTSRMEAGVLNSAAVRAWVATDRRDPS